MAPVPGEEGKMLVSNQVILFFSCKNAPHILGVRLFTIIDLSRKGKDKDPM